MQHTGSALDEVHLIDARLLPKRITTVPAPEPLQSDEEADDDDDQEAHSKTIYDVLAPLAEHWAPSVKPLMSMLASGAGVKALASGAGATQASESDLSSKPSWEIRHVVDLNDAAAKAKAKKEAAQAASAKPSLQARVMADPELMTHFLAIKSLLDPDDRSSSPSVIASTVTNMNG